MAKPSEQISTRWIKGARRECWVCGKPIKNLTRDVGEVRTRFPGNIREIKCSDCLLHRTEKEAQ